MNYNQLKADISAVVRANGAHEITGDALQQILKLIVDSLGGHYQFAGTASPDYDPEVSDERVVYIAFTEGDYPAFGGLHLDAGEVALLVHGAVWDKETLPLLTTQMLVPISEATEAALAAAQRANTAAGVSEQDHTRAEQDHVRAGDDHTRAGQDHIQAAGDHTQAATDHAQAGTDHSRAEQDHARAEQDHSTASGDHTQAEGDHAASSELIEELQGYDDKLTELSQEVSELEGSTAKLTNFGYASMSTPAETSEKEISKQGYQLNANTILVLRLYTGNSADNLTLDINNTGAKPLYYNGDRASSKNCWNTDEMALLITTGSTYYLYSVSDWKIKSLLSKLGHTDSEEWNYFLKELYLEGLDENESYFLSTVRKDTASSRWAFYINKTGAYGADYAVAMAYLTEENNFVEVVPQNNSGINGYAVVNWNEVTAEGYTRLYGSIKLRNDIISNIEFNPTIYSYVNSKKQDYIINNLSKGVQNATNDIQRLENEVHSLGGSSSDMANMLLESKIREERSYFLNADWNGATSYESDSYLNEKINSIPEGKHFIFTTDSHIDYYNVGLTQKDTEIMSYVKSKVGGCVVFGGDCIGSQNTDYKAARVLSVYANDKFNAFGADFLWCQGNHDANATDGQNKVKSSEIYKRTTQKMQKYGKAVFNTEGIAMIDTITSLSAEQKKEAKAWMNLHYYYDDTKNKLRFIVLEGGDGSYGGSCVYPNSFEGWSLVWSYMTFVGDALKSTPLDYDVVVVVHQYYKSVANGETTTGKGYGSLYDLLRAFKNHTNVTITQEGGLTTSALTTIAQNTIGSGKTYDFSGRTSGRAFVVSGHSHCDDAWIVKCTEPTPSAWYYKGKEYGQWDSLGNTATLVVQTDRACLYDNNTDRVNYPNAVSYPSQLEESRQDTKNEVLFDVITLTSDNKVVCTRIGAGEDRVYNLPF